MCILSYLRVFMYESSDSKPSEIHITVKPLLIMLELVFY